MLAPPATPGNAGAPAAIGAATTLGAIGDPINRLRRRPTRRLKWRGRASGPIRAERAKGAGAATGRRWRGPAPQPGLAGPGS
eukprot:11193248-Lingulodinium_polyedra.AAC.1